jgi:hypothetical protein
VKHATDLPDSPETIAAMIAAADRRISALSREVERSLASRVPDTKTASVTPAPLPRPHPAASVAARAQPAAARIAAIAASAAALVCRSWPRSIAANAGLAVMIATLLLVFFWPVSAPPSAQQAQPPAESAAATNAAPAAAVQSEPPAGPPTGVTMTLVASGQCWIRAVADGARTIERLLRAGETLQLRGEDQIVLRVGDAGAVQVSINGQAVAPLGARGEVITRRFSRSHRVL